MRSCRYAWDTGQISHHLFYSGQSCDLLFNHHQRESCQNEQILNCILIECCDEKQLIMSTPKSALPAQVYYSSSQVTWFTLPVIGSERHRVIVIILKL